MEFVDGADVGMIQGRGGLGLPHESILDLGDMGQLRRQELEGHGPLETGVLGLVDDPHPPAAELLDDSIFPGDYGVLRDGGWRGHQGLRQRGPIGARQIQRGGAAAAVAGIVFILGVTVGAFHRLFFPSGCPRYIIRGKAGQPRTGYSPKKGKMALAGLPGQIKGHQE
jgi:hypothetical protein